jgi:Cys-rich repeat protein
MNTSPHRPTWLRGIGIALLLGAAGCAGSGQGTVQTDMTATCTGKTCAGTCTCGTGLKCDTKTHDCVGCLADSDCPMGEVCDPATRKCAPGCSTTQACAPDGGRCELDAGLCVQCLSDADCIDPASPRCDLVKHQCNPCLPTNDNCSYGMYCGMQGNAYLCVPGCKDDSDCGPAKPPMPDLGGTGSDDAGACSPDDGGFCGPVDGGSGPGDGASGPVDAGTMPPNLTPRCDQKIHACVRCLTDSDCPLGRVCKAEQCVPGCTDVHACDATGMLTCCDFMCTDTTADNSNCGSCGQLCQGGWNCCSSKCTNPVNDINNCGGCQIACVVANGTPTCAARNCSIANCFPGYGNCNGAYMDGCETNTNIDPANCGSCGHKCIIPHANPNCTAGVCGIDTCLGTYGDCDNNVANGCEDDVSTDPKNCGACGAPCSNNNIANPTCVGSQCTGACNLGYGDCNMDRRTDGCEANLKTDPANCGGCGITCASQCVVGVAPGGTVCNNGACGIAMGGCQPFYYDLDGVCSNGCECQGLNVGGTCTMPIQSPSIAVGQPPIIYVGNIPIAGGESWYSVTFSGSTNLAYHPKVTISDPNNAFQFDIITDCTNLTSTMPCGATEGGASNGRTAWEVQYTAGDPNSFSPPDMAGVTDDGGLDGGTDDGGAGNNPDGGVMGKPNFAPIPPVGNNGVIYIRVFRVNGQPVNCNQYTLTISD